MTEQVATERRLSLTYVLLIVVGATASITSGIAWGHWKGTLDQCIGAMGARKNCSCILYGQYTPAKFLGGDISSCIWVSFGPLIYILYCIGMACFHGYRVLFSSRSTRTRTVMSKNDAGEMVEIRAIQVDDTDPLPKFFWYTVSVFAVFFTVYSIVHFAIFLDGFYKTCNEYRKVLEKILGIHGTAIPVIHGRLSCQGVFDFMDYMQPDSANAYRDGFINTGADLILGVVASSFSCLLFFVASFLNIRRAISASKA